MPFDLDDDEYRATRILTGADKPEEIKAREYVRTKEGIIDEVIIDYKRRCNNPNCERKHVSCKYNFYDEEEIVKHSPNIIDLIEVGDYVNGKSCVDIEEYVRDDGTTNISLICLGGSVLAEDIKSVVTKQQFKSVEYKVGG